MTGALRRVVLASPLLLGAAATSCSTEGGYGGPSVGVGSVAPLTLRVDNVSKHDVYVTVDEDGVVFEVKRQSEPLVTVRGCHPECDFGCGCDTCAPTVTRVRRIAPGQSFAMTWEAVHYVIQPCADQAACSCVERWPMTAGRHSVEVRGFDAVVGGVPAPEDPDVVVGAAMAETASECTGMSMFDLAGGAEVVVGLRCAS
ncbi:MAG: hypothetical protein MUF54_07770 [Polyangiaceae bacterium]|jgi:hypothetical protein|nr:hypothetical protein [Polyangiaceae bacterium]